MNLVVLYLLLAKATVTTFSGLSSLPIVRHDLVERRRVLTDRELNAAVAAGQMAPGPNGLYIASVGYFVAGVPGAAVGCLAVMTPAFLIVPLLRFLGQARNPRVRGAVQGVTIAAAGLVANAAVPLARDAITGAPAAVIAAGAFLFVAMTRRATAWAVLGGAVAGLLGTIR